MNTPDTVTVSSDQNPVFWEVLRNMKPGDKGKVELQYTVKDNSRAEGCDLAVDAYVPEGYEVAEPGDDKPTAGSVAPGDAMMTPAAMAVRKKQSKT